MSKIKSALYPVLQRARYAEFISRFEKAKKQPMADNKILMYSTSKGRLGGNLLAIKNYIEKNGLDYDITVAAGENIPPADKLASLMAQSKFILVDDYEPLVYVLRLRENQHLVQVWHAMGAFKRFGYGRASAEKNSLTHKNYTEAIVSSPEIAPIYAEAFGIGESRIKPIGTPRTDVFFDCDYVAAAKERLYSQYPLLRGKKICLFAPTFRGANVHDAEYPEGFFDCEKFANALGTDLAVIIKMHPFIKKPVQIPKSVSNRVFDLSTEREINDILFITDVLVTDYSSVIFENAVIGNACVLYAPDLEQYTDGRGFYFDYSDYSCGSVVHSFSELPQAVLAAKPGEAQRKFKERFVSLCDGNSSARFVETILESKK